MKKRLMLIEFQIKECVRTIPKAFAVILITTALVWFAAYVYMQILGGDDEKFKTALVVNDTNVYTEAAISYLSEDEKVKELCEFVRMDEEDALNSLNAGVIQAVVLIPEGFFDGILYGNNISSRIILNKSGQLSQLSYFREMITAGARSLAIAQAAIYAADDVTRIMAPDIYAETESYLNKVLFKAVLRRNTLFNTELVSENGNTTILGFYYAGAVMAIIILSMIVSCSIFSVNDSNRLLLLRMRGIHPLENIYLRYIGNDIFYGILLCLAYVIISVFCGQMMDIGAFFKIILLTAGLVTFTGFFASLSENVNGSVFICICALPVLLVLSGNIVPLSLMPSVLRGLGRIMPLRYYTLLIAQLLGNIADNVLVEGMEASCTDICIGIIVWSGVFILLTCILLKKRAKL